MRSFFAYFHAALAQRCLQMADATHLNYWGPSVPLTLLACLGSLVWMVALADPRVPLGSSLLGLYGAYVILNGGRLGVGAWPPIPASPRPAAGAVYLATLVAALFPLLVEVWLGGGLLCLAGQMPLGVLLGLSVAALFATATGLFWAPRARTSASACLTTYLLLTFGATLLGAAGLLVTTYRMDEVSRWIPYLPLVLAFALTPVMADTVGRLQVAERTPPPGQGPAVPHHPSLAFLSTCACKSLSWGFRPWSRYAITTHLRAWWYTIGLCSVLFLGCVYCTVLTVVHNGEVTRLNGCEGNERMIDYALYRYAGNNRGQYPRTLQELVPRYLQSVPTCPAAGTDTYSGSYTTASEPGAAAVYTLYCEGAHHLSVSGPNGPCLTHRWAPHYNLQAISSGH